MIFRKIAKVFLYFFITVNITLVLTEFAVRKWAPQELISDVIAFENDFCHRLKRNATGVQNSREFSVELKTNALGLRDREYPLKKNKDAFRILILGDSHTFGWGVEIEDIFSKIIEYNLNLNSVKFSYSVINCGVYGYGTGHQFHFLQKYGYQLNPDLVILAMDFFHDIEINNSGYYYFNEDRLVRTSKRCFAKKSRAITQYIPFSSYLRGYSQLFRYVGKKIQIFNNNINSKTHNSGNNANNYKVKYDLANTKEIFRRLNIELNNRRIKFAVAILPEFKSSKKSGYKPFLWEELNLFENLLTKENIPHILLQENFELRNSSDLTFKYSYHFNSKGHQFIATQIEKFLYEQRLLGK